MLKCEKLKDPSSEEVSEGPISGKCRQSTQHSARMAAFFEVNSSSEIRSRLRRDFSFSMRVPGDGCDGAGSAGAGSAAGGCCLLPMTARRSSALAALRACSILRTSSVMLRHFAVLPYLAAPALRNSSTPSVMHESSTMLMKAGPPLSVRRHGALASLASGGRSGLPFGCGGGDARPGVLSATDAWDGVVTGGCEDAGEAGALRRSARSALG